MYVTTNNFEYSLNADTTVHFEDTGLRKASTDCKVKGKVGP